MARLLSRVASFLRSLEPSPQCPHCGYLIHGETCEVCGGDPENVEVREDGEVLVRCHKCGLLVDGLKGPFSCRCR